MSSISSYQKFFKNKLQEYGVKSPAELSKQEKSKFFTEIEKEWDKDSLNESENSIRSYQKFFKDKLQEYGVKSPAQLSKQQKSKFFTEIEKEWDKE